MNPLFECRLYGILDTGYVAQERLVPVLLALIEGGVDILQLRAKRNSQEEILAMAREIAPICRAAGIPFILNDYPELVQEAGADGADHAAHFPEEEDREERQEGADIDGPAVHERRQHLGQCAPHPRQFHR